MIAVTNMLLMLFLSFMLFLDLLTRECNIPDNCPIGTPTQSKEEVCRDCHELLVCEDMKLTKAWDELKKTIREETIIGKIINWLLGG